MVLTVCRVGTIQCTWSRWAGVLDSGLGWVWWLWCDGVSNGGSSEGLMLIPIYTIRDVLGRTTARHIVAAKYEMSIYINFGSHCMRESSARTQGIQKLAPYHPPPECGMVKTSRGKQYGWTIYIYIYTHYIIHRPRIGGRNSRRIRISDSVRAWRPTMCEYGGWRFSKWPQRRCCGRTSLGNNNGIYHDWRE